MNIKTLVHKIRYKIRYGSTVEWYNFWYIVLRRKQKVIPRVASIDETIQTVIDKHCAVSRYGDGEMLRFFFNLVEKYIFHNHLYFE